MWIVSLLNIQSLGYAPSPVNIAPTQPSVEPVKSKGDNNLMEKPQHHSYLQLIPESGIKFLLFMRHYLFWFCNHFKIMQWEYYALLIFINFASEMTITEESVLCFIKDEICNLFWTVSIVLTINNFRGIIIFLLLYCRGFWFTSLINLPEHILFNPPYIHLAGLSYSV